MKVFHLSLFILFFFTFSGVSQGQNLKENEMVIIQGKKFILHQVRTGETIYSITRDFKIDAQQLKIYNPKIAEGLSIGDILKIPFNENIDLSEIPGYKKGDPTGFVDYIIESRGETAYSISKQFGVTVEEIYAYNPDVNRLKRGMKIKIPVWEVRPNALSNVTKPEETVAITVENSKTDFLEHLVVSGETLFAIGRKYKVPESEILYYNPAAKNLKAGSKLKIPQKADENKAVAIISEGNSGGGFINHKVEPGETIFGITRRYQVSEEELKTLNPELSTGFRSGSVLKIPVKKATSQQVQSNQQVSEIKNDTIGYKGVKPLHNVPSGCRPNNRITDDKLTVVALFLPLFVEANLKLNDETQEIDDNIANKAENEIQLNTDTIVELDKPLKMYRQFYGNSENFLQFYEGVIIAVDSMQKAGMKIELNVFDTKDNPESIRRIVNRDDFKKTDLIIGPVYENVQKEVAHIAALNHIPMVSPFTPKSDIIYSIHEFFQINPTREYLAEATADLIAANYSNANFIVVRTSAYEGTPEGQLVELIKRRIARQGYPDEGSFKVYDFRKERAGGLRNILLPGKENFVFIPSSDEGELSVAISNLNNLAKDYPITLIGASNYQQRYPSIEVAHYHNLKLKYINPYWIDYRNRSTINYFEKFVSFFGTEPNSYGVQGFDVAWYFLNALKTFGRDFNDCLPYLNVQLVQGNYHFKKVSPTGGYMNQGVSVIRYNNNFEVERQAVIGKPKNMGEE